MKGKPTIAGFLSYVHADDEYENGRISRICERLERAIRFHSGLRAFRVFQDRRDIGLGEQWEKVIADSIENSVVLFPIVTPSYFTSERCREEILAFEKRQLKLDRDDLILPIYYAFSELMDEADGGPAESEEARIAALIKQHQFEDWRALRQTEETDPAYPKAIERLALRAIPALKKGMTASARSSAASPTRAAATSPPREAEASTPAEADRGLAGEVANAQAAPGYVATVTVDQMPGRGQFTTISEAIARAAAGTRVHIRPGHYRERLVINKPLEIVGDGPREDIVIDADDGTTIIFDTNIGVIRGLTLRQSGDKRTFVIRVNQGRLALEDCDLSGSNLSCLAVTNNADPRVRHNVIHNAKQSGIFVFSQGRGTYEDNEIFSNGFSGFATSTEAEPIVRRNRIHENRASGISAFREGRGTYEDNEIFDNGGAGVTAKQKANPIVRRNRIYENKQSGIDSYEQGRGTYEDNDVFANENQGFATSDEADPIVRRNRIHENKSNGIYVYKNARGTYEDNEIFGNRAAGVLVQSGGAPVVRHNRINKNGYEAVWVDEGGAGVYEQNDLRENIRGPWDIHASASTELKRARNIEK